MMSQQSRFYWKGKRVTEGVYLQRVKATKYAEARRGDGGLLTSTKTLRLTNCLEDSVIVSCGVSLTNNDSASNDDNCFGAKQREMRRGANSPTKTLTESSDFRGDFTTEGSLGSSFPTLRRINDSGSSVDLLQVDGESLVSSSSGGVHNLAWKRIKCGCDTRYDPLPRDVLNGGLGVTHVNKVLGALNIPETYYHTYQLHEKEVGRVMEQLAHDNCLEAALEERRLTILNAEKLLDLLPPHLDLKFIFPNASVLDIENRNILACIIVRFAGSFDVGWFTRSTGRAYNSLSGTGTLIGYFTGKIIGYVTLNRKCAKCHLGHEKSDHDCRLNFEGSVKSMESRAAVLLTKDNEILKKCSLQLGIFIADNDSTATLAVREVNDHEIVKQSDKNHTTKGVVSSLYKINKKHKELTSDRINYLKKCFTYAVSQNLGNREGMEKAIKNIPYHGFNIHDDCGSWCKYELDPENYKHANIGDGFHSELLFEALKEIFSVLTGKSGQFVSGASNNRNESANSMFVSKAPKSRCYAKTPSATRRVACPVNKKNCGEKYVVEAMKALHVSPGQHTKNTVARIDQFNSKCYAVSVTQKAKFKRIQMKKCKIRLKNSYERQEGVTYESNVGLTNTITESVPLPEVDGSQTPVMVLYDLETGGLGMEKDILKLAAKCGKREFSVNIQPSKSIHKKATDVHGLRNIGGKLYERGQELLTMPLHEALLSFLEFLASFNGKLFHSSRLRFLRHPSSHKKEDWKKGKGDNKLEFLAKSSNIDSGRAHDALGDVIMLEQVIQRLGITDEDLRSIVVTWDDAHKRTTKTPEESQKPNASTLAFKNLDPLKNCITSNMRKKIATAQINYEMIIAAHKIGKFEAMASEVGFRWRETWSELLRDCEVV
ncbi:hypothetical protein QAD02_005597 [Eretmocerus hayati]|uniref:Uncharacterized protein n=1 Tax=Eretmocerus hayati TaxID=131215 RepID=A0ACC2NSS2_9HYME|nr:hypothetical protein QAD02_005597 [Eretmocerus hayati]